MIEVFLQDRRCFRISLSRNNIEFYPVRHVSTMGESHQEAISILISIWHRNCRNWGVPKPYIRYPTRSM